MLRALLIPTIFCAFAPNGTAAILQKNQLWNTVGDLFKIQSLALAFDSGSGPRIVSTGTLHNDVYREFRLQETVAADQSSQFTWSYNSKGVKDSELNLLTGTGDKDGTMVRAINGEPVSGWYNLAPILDGTLLDDTFVQTNRLLALTEVETGNPESNRTTFTYTIEKGDDIAWVGFNLDFGVLGTPGQTGLVSSIFVSGAASGAFTLTSGGTAGDEFAAYSVDSSQFNEGDVVNLSFQVDMLDGPESLGSFAMNFSNTAIPEPATVTLGCLAGLVIAGRTWRRRKGTLR